jgi:hypothetical protein
MSPNAQTLTDTLTNPVRMMTTISVVAKLCAKLQKRSRVLCAEVGDFGIVLHGTRLRLGSRNANDENDNEGGDDRSRSIHLDIAQGQK